MHILKNEFKKMPFDASTHLSPELFDWAGQFSADTGDLSNWPKLSDKPMIKTLEYTVEW